MTAAFTLVLASSSSRRHRLFQQLVDDFSIYEPNIDESIHTGEITPHYVKRMALEKSTVVMNQVEECGAIIAADTAIELDGQFIGKPKSIDNAIEIISKLSANEHLVHTALCIRYKSKRLQKNVVSKVKFKSISYNEIRAYCDTEEPLGKAGAYAIQGHAARFVEYIVGSYSSVIGLPLLETYVLLRDLGLLNYSNKK